MLFEALQSLRRGEILGLTWDKVSLETLEVHVLAPTSKSRKERVVPISPDMAKLFREWKEKQPDAKGGRCWRSRTGLIDAGVATIAAVPTGLRTNHG